MSTDQQHTQHQISLVPVEPTAAANSLTTALAVPLSFTPDERLARIFNSQGANQYLEQLLTLIQEYKDTAHPIGAIHAIFQRWANGEDMSTDEVTNSFGRILTLLQFLDELASYYDCILIESDNERQF